MIVFARSFSFCCSLSLSLSLSRLTPVVVVAVVVLVVVGGVVVLLLLLPVLLLMLLFRVWVSQLVLLWLLRLWSKLGYDHHTSSVNPAIHARLVRKFVHY